MAELKLIKSNGEPQYVNKSEDEDYVALVLEHGDGQIPTEIRWYADGRVVVRNGKDNETTEIYRF
jgi:hypothetical protein